MTLRKIAQVGEPVLREVARSLSKDELLSEPYQDFIDDLVETMRDANGAGLAANQIYTPVQICALEVQDNPRYPYKPNIPLTILVNPKLSPLDEQQFENFEGCLSVPNLRGRVRRFARIRVEAWDRHGQVLDFEARGITAGTYQHEVDHLLGTLFLDRVHDSKSLCTWDNFMRFERESFVSEAMNVVKTHGA